MSRAGHEVNDIATARALCVVGVAQETIRPPGPAPEPLDSWQRVARAAAADAGAPGILTAVDSVQVVYCQTWPYDDPVGRLCDALGATPRHRIYSGIGGTTPQVLLNDTAAAMRRNELDSALIVGAAALATVRAAKRAGERLAWSHRQRKHRYPWAPPHESELAHEVFQAWETFPLWDTARRAARGDDLAAYSSANAALMARLSRVAARNPHAWRPTALDADAIGSPTAGNRYVGWPYTKAEVAVMDVDMAAALLVVTHERADALAIPADRRVYLHGYADAEDPESIAARPDPARSTGMESAGPAALAAAGVTADDLSCLDLYSCFPSALNLACDAFGLRPDDPRDLTVTGGLPFAGGPASAYVLHSVATTVERLRAAPGHGLVTGVGMHLAKHVAAVYGTEPPAGGSAAAPAARPVAAVPVVTIYEGVGTVAAYTVAHARDGAPSLGLAVLNTATGRALARFHRADLLADAEARELVGQRVTVRTDGRRNEITW